LHGTGDFFLLFLFVPSASQQFFVFIKDFQGLLAAYKWLDIVCLAGSRRQGL
jgi:hypothetical protein